MADAALDLSISRSLDLSSLWLPLSDLVATERLPVGERQLQRICRKLARVGQARRQSGRWEISRDAEISGRPVHAWLAEQGTGNRERGTEGGVASDTTYWSSSDRNRYLNTRQLLAAWRRFRRRHGGTFQQATAAFAVTRVADVFPRSPFPVPRSLTIAEWAADHGLSVKPTALRRYQRRLKRDGNVDRRGRPRGGQADTSPAAWDHFKALWLAPQRRSVALCWELTAAEANRHGWAWPALRTIQVRVGRKLPPPIADYYRRGRQYWERHHAPKIRRDYSAIRPNQIWVGDEHRFDFLALSADGRPVRLWLTAWQDMRSRRFVGWSIDVQAHSDTILAALCNGIRTYGAPLELIIDNGKDYRAHAVAGGKRRKQRVEEERLSSICARLDVEPHFCWPFNPGAKPIESAFRTVCERFSKLFDSYCGGSPDDRPEDLYRRLRRDEVDVPTIDRVRELFAAWVERAYHTKPHSGDGMNGRTPNEVFDAENPVPKRTAPADLLDWLLLKEIKRKVTQRGINVDDVYYGQGHTQTFELIGQNVLVKIDSASRDFVHVCALDGRYLYTAERDELRGLDTDDIRKARSRIKAARQIIKRAAAVGATAARTVEEEALIVAQADYNEQLAATGTDGDPALPDRSIQLLPTAGEVLDSLPSSYGGRSATFTPLVDPLDGLDDPEVGEQGTGNGEQDTGRSAFSSQFPVPGSLDPDPLDELDDVDPSPGPRTPDPDDTDPLDLLPESNYGEDGE